MNKRLYIHRLGDFASSYYRQTLPARHLRVPGVDITCEPSLAHLDYDAFWLPLLINPTFLPVIDAVRRGGRKVVWDTDDNLWSIPAWNPAARTYTWEALALVNCTARLASDVCVSTEPLKWAASRSAMISPDKICVCPNLVDLDDWPQTLPPREEGPVRILWTGSQHHDVDLKEIVGPLERVMEEYKDRVQVIFQGDWPAQMAEWARIRHTHLSCQVPAQKYQGRLTFVNPVHLQSYPQTICDIRPDIALAPLCNDSFNDSKSGIKWYECSLAGAAMIATDLPPYQAVRRGIDGLLVPPGDQEGWYRAIKSLIDAREWREDMARQGRQRVVNEFSWQHGDGRKAWEDFIKRIGE